jgi:hypothetical protein
MQTHLEMTPSIPHEDTVTAPVADVASAAPRPAHILIHMPSAAIVAAPRRPASPWYSDPAASRGM